MLGTEYNWLISHTRQADGAPRVTLGGGGLITLAVAVFCFLCVALRAAPAPAAGADETAWAIPGMTGIIEGLAINPATGEDFFSDVHNHCIWYRDTRGSHAVMKKFSAESDGLLGVFALKIDDAGRTLWASCSALPEMAGYTVADRGRAFLAAYDLPTRRLRRKYELPADGRAHVLGDFVLAADGSVYVTDSLAPVIWRLAPGGDRLQKWQERSDFKSLQGIVQSADRRSLYVADYPHGIWRLQIASHAATLLPVPAGVNLHGVDGLYPVRGGLVAVQNGTNPQRILRIVLDAGGDIAAVDVQLAGDPAMTDLSLGQVINGRLHFIANSGWELYANPAATVAPRDVVILNTSAD